MGPTITGGVIAYPLDAAWDVLRHFRDITASLPDELMVFGGLIHAPDGSGTKLAAMVVCHCGSLADGEVAVRNDQVVRRTCHGCDRTAVVLPDEFDAG